MNIRITAILQRSNLALMRNNCNCIKWNCIRCERTQQNSRLFNIKRNTNYIYIIKVNKKTLKIKIEKIRQKYLWWLKDKPKSNIRKANKPKKEKQIKYSKSVNIFRLCEIATRKSATEKEKKAAIFSSSSFIGTYKNIHSITNVQTI